MVNSVQTFVFGTYLYTTLFIALNFGVFQLLVRVDYPCP